MGLHRKNKIEDYGFGASLGPFRTKVKKHTDKIQNNTVYSNSMEIIMVHFHLPFDASSSAFA